MGAVNIEGGLVSIHLSMILLPPRAASFLLGKRKRGKQEGLAMIAIEKKEEEENETEKKNETIIACRNNH